MKKNDGKAFEILTKDFFSNLFNKLGFVIHKERIQFSGTQDGFDVQIMISENFNERNIFFECKDYSNDLNFGNIYSKAHDLEANYNFTEKDMAFFISPRACFGNSRNPEKSEPIFNNGKFRFHTRLLDLSNGIDRLFATNKNIYKEIYKKDCLYEVDEKTEYEKFKSILFSRGPIKKVYINKRDRHNYIINIKKEQFYISRTLSSPKVYKTERNFQLNQHDNKSIDLIKATENLFLEDTNDGIVLLGNPGTGKSIELQNTAIHFWENRNNNNWVPFYRPVNSFISNSEITDYLPNEWKNIPYLLIILDGLDEISYSLEFKTKLDNFLIENTDSRIKFIISCRTNIYENVIKNIGNFKCFILDDLRHNQSLEYLDNKYNLSFNDFPELIYNSEQKEFFESPYYLDLLGHFYKETNSLPSNKVELIEEYIEKRLEYDRVFKYKNKNYDKSQIKVLCKKVALSLEAMQQTKFRDSKLNSLLKIDRTTFTNSCFVEKVFNEDMWKFEHKNMQEYFVASALRDLSVEDIISFIRLSEDCTKTHPSWLNSISHLINLFDSKSKKLKALVNWLTENDPEVLFKADKNRITNKIKAQVFQDYFNKKCKEDTLWIRTYDKGVKDLANFSECEENINYLIKEIKDKGNHRRTKISALDLLSNMSVNYRIDEIQKVLIELIKAPIDEVDFSFKSNVIDSIKSLKLYKHNNKIIDEIIICLGDIDHIEVTSSVLKLILEVECNNYLKYITQITPKILDNSKRKYQRKDNLITGEKSTLKKVLKELNTYDGCIFELNTYLDNKYKFEAEANDIENIILRIVQLFQNDDSIYSLMLSYVLKNLRFNRDSEDIVASFFIITNTTSRAFLEIYNSNVNIDLKRKFLTYLTGLDSLEFILNEYKENRIEKKEVFYFRNSLSYTNFDLSLKFQDLIVRNTNYSFENNLLSKENNNSWKKFYESKKQNEFDILFDIEGLKTLTRKYFMRFKKGQFTRDNQLDDRKEYYQNIELQIEFPQTFLNLVNKSFSYISGKSITEENVLQTIDSEFYIIYTIKHIIENDKNSELKFKDSQISFIKNWCLENISKASFKDSYDLNKRNNYLRCSLLSFFREKFNLLYPDEILLEMLCLNENSNYTTDKNTSSYDYIVKQVGEKKVHQRIIQNFETGIPSQAVFLDHSFVAIENNLNSVYDRITEFLINEEESYSVKVRILEKYIEKTNDISLLQNLINFKFENDYSDIMSWTAIKLLLEKGQNAFVIEKLLEAARLNINEKNRLEIIRFLIRSNYKKAFKLFKNWIIDSMPLYNRELNHSITSTDWNNHTNPKSIPYLIDLIEISSDSKYKFRDFSNPIRITVETLQCITQNNDSETCLEVIDLIEKCKTAPENKSIDKFYFNTIINDTWQDYYKHISKPISFPEIAKRINDYYYDFT